MRYAIVDIGSNTVKISVYDDGDGALRHVLNQSTMLGLAGHCRNGVLSDEGVQALQSTLLEYQKLTDLLAVDRVAYVATASLRNIDNAMAVTERIRRQSGIAIHVISGEREAELGFLGLKTAVGALQDGYFFDLGGASTEVITIRDGRPCYTTSLPFGALKLYHAHVKGIIPKAEEAEAIRHFVRKHVETALPRSMVDSTLAYLTGGTSKAIGKLTDTLFRERKDRRGRYTTGEIAETVTLLMSGGDEILHKVASRVSDRLHMLAPGMLTLLTMWEHLGIKTVHVVYSGIRDGYVAEMSGGIR